MAQSAVPVAAQVSGRDKRSSPRTPVALPVLISTYEGQHPARIHNLSRGGALIEAHTALRAGNQVDFQCGSIETRGTVVWREDNCFGICFRFPVDEAQVAQQVARSDAAARHRQPKDTEAAAQALI